jgi:uncharacterized protein (TIGR02117 family)
MRSHLIVIGVALLVPLAAGCTATHTNLAPALADDETRTVYVVSHGWHTGLVLRRDDISSDAWPEHFDLTPTRYVEVGWGSGVFYMAPRITPAVVMEAMCWSDSVLHVAGFNPPPARAFPSSDVYAVRLSERGFDDLCRAIHETYVHDEQGQPVRKGPGLYGESQFYEAKGRYYFPNTCNVWTARVLRSAGCPIEPLISATSTAVILQTSCFAKQLSGQ